MVRSSGKHRLGQDSPLKDRLLNILKVAISLGLVAFIFMQEDIRTADWGAILADFRVWIWLLALAIYFVAIGFNVFKWQHLLRTLRIEVTFPSLYRHNIVGLFFANLPLSMVGGDIARNEALPPRSFPQIDNGRCRYCNFFGICKDGSNPDRLPA